MEDLTYEDTPQASHDAVHAARDAQQAVELAREVQLEKAVKETARQTKEALLEGLKEVFGDTSEDPGQMKVLVRRIPILCTSIDQMHKDISDIKDSQKWAMRAIVGGMISIVVAVVIAAILK